MCAQRPSGALSLAIAATVLCTVRGALPAAQTAALVTLYQATGGASWTLSSNWLQGDPCTSAWFGIYCNEDNTGAVVVSLNANKLTGTIPSALSALGLAGIIDLSQNALIGTIPKTLSALTNLGIVSLNSNQLTGSIPTSFSALTGLALLDLGFNRLVGSIPSSLSTLTELIIANVTHNLLSGSVPRRLTGTWDVTFNCLSNCTNSCVAPALCPSITLSPKAVGGIAAACVVVVLGVAGVAWYKHRKDKKKDKKEHKKEQKKEKKHGPGSGSGDAYHAIGVAGGQSEGLEVGGYQSGAEGAHPHTATHPGGYGSTSTDARVTVA